MRASKMVILSVLKLLANALIKVKNGSRFIPTKKHFKLPEALFSQEITTFDNQKIMLIKCLTK